MAYDKVIDSAKLDADITTIADAIRARSGASGKLAFPNGMADVVRSITSGTELPTLTKPEGTASDLAAGKQLISSNGTIVEGNVKEVSTVYTTPNPKATMEWDDDWKVSNVLEEDVLLRKGTTVNTWFDRLFFGDAKPEDVRKGVTFTAGSLHKKEGTLIEEDLLQIGENVRVETDDGTIEMVAPVTTDCILRKGSQSRLIVNSSAFGNATEDDVLADKEFTSSAGLCAKGNIPKKTANDIIVSGATATIPRGYYESTVSKSVSTATQATPSISVDTAGKITASVTQTAGYVSSGTKTATRQLATQTAQTITPGTQNKTIASGVYLTGTQTIKGDANLVAANIKKGVSIFGVPGSLDVSSGGSSGGTTVTSDICEVHPITIASEQNNTTVSLLTGNSFLAEHYADEGLLVVLVSLDNLSGVYHRIGAIYHGNRPTMTYSGSTGYGAFTFVNKSTYVTTLSNGACTVPISNANTYQTTRLSVNSSGDLNCYIPSDKYLARGSYVVALVLASA